MAHPGVALMHTAQSEQVTSSQWKPVIFQKECFRLFEVRRCSTATLQSGRLTPSNPKMVWFIHFLHFKMNKFAVLRDLLDVISNCSLPKRGAGAVVEAACLESRRSRVRTLSGLQISNKQCFPAHS